MWNYAARRIVACMAILEIFTSAVFIVKGAYTQAGLLLVPLTLLLLQFDSFLDERYRQAVNLVPLRAVHRAPRCEVDLTHAYTPAPLRDGAEDWYPEWGKVSGLGASPGAWL